MTIVWLVLWAGLLIFELLSPAFFCLFFSFGALCAAAVAWFDYSLAMQLFAFSLNSVVSLLFLRKTLKNIFIGKTSNNEHPLIGQYATVSKEIFPNKIGEISAGGSFWKATSTEHIEINKDCLIVESVKDDALILIVETVKD